MIKKLITIKEVSEVLDCSISQVRKLDDSGELTCDSREGNQRRYLKSKVLSYRATQNTIETYVFIGMPKSDPAHKEWRNSALKFCTANSLPKISVIDEFFSDISNEPLLLSRHLAAQIVEHRPINFVLGCPDLIDPAALSTLLSICRLYRINTHFLFGAQ
jgi:hypothetical protein